jgi:hypothetical protein
MRATLILLGGIVVALLVPIRGVAVDVNGDSKHDFLLREQPYLPYANVGSNCDVYRSNSPWHGRLYVRPPIVWGLPRLGRSQRVVWRTRFYDVPSGQVRYYGGWRYSTADPYRATAFGGGSNAPAVSIVSRGYWAGSQWYDHFADDGDKIRAIVDVRWYNRNKRTWVRASLRVRWVIGTSNRTNGLGYSNSPPQRDASC